MTVYKKILIALDFHSDNSEILVKGREIAERIQQFDYYRGLVTCEGR